MHLTSIPLFNDMIYDRFPFVSTDILTSCLKIADKMIEVIEVED